MSTQAIHPAALANMNSIKYAMAKDKAAWLALYRDDAVLRDPVGVSPLDPKGLGHNGKEAIAKFWDMIIANSNITITPGLRCPSGTHTCAVPMRAENQITDTIKTVVDMIAVYEVDDAGLIVSMSAYWDWSVMEAQLKQLGFA